ncbi:MAG: diguanylate cyclase domain-containing protein [Desulforhopalus sp.]
MRLFDHLPSPTIHLDKDARIIDVNSLALSLLGWRTTPSNCTSFSDLVDPEKVYEFKDFFRRIPAEQPLSFNSNLHLDGDRRLPVTIKSSATPDGDRIFLINRHDVYSSGCGEKCLNAAILEAQYEQNPGGILLVNDQLEMVSFNKEFVTIWDIPKEIQDSRDDKASLDHVLGQIVDPESFLQKVKGLYDDSEASSTDEINLLDGRVLYRHTYPIRFKNEYLGRAWYFLDITNLKEAQYQIEKQQIFLNSILEHIQDGIIACDADGKVSLLNRASRELYGKGPLPLSDGLLAQALAGVTLSNKETVICSRGNSERTVRVSGQAMYDGDDNILGAVVSLHDITDLKKAKEQLRFMAYHDALTKLPNRRLFHDLLQHSIKRAQRHQQQLAVLFLDLDDFKSVNDSHGHDVGDQLLVTIAGTLQSCLRNSDILCRWGGDEFVIGLLESSGGVSARAVAKKLCKKVLENISGSDDGFQVSVSIGVTMYPDHGAEPDLLIRNADMAMYQAKRSGKNRCALFMPDLAN